MINFNVAMRPSAAVRGCILLAVASILFVIAISAAPASANNQLVVSKTADTNDGVCDADCSLRESLTEANDTAGDNSILFNVPVEDAGCTAANTCTITLASELIVSDIGGVTTIDGSNADITISGNDSTRIIKMEPGTELSVQNLALVKGSIDGDGGAIYVGEKSTLSVKGSIFSGNTLEFYTSKDDVRGGAIFVAEDGDLTVHGSSFIENSANTFGARGHGAAIANLGTTNIFSSVFADNYSDASAVRNGDTLNVYDSTFSGNLSSHRYSSWAGGAISGGAVMVSGSTFVKNGSDGEPSSRSITSCGAVITNSTFSDTGGIVDICEGATISSSTFYKSYIEVVGVVTNTVFANAYCDINHLCGNCIVAVGVDIDGGGNISDDERCRFSQPSSQNSTDPKLDPVLADNGGPTETHALPLESPAIDTAVAASCPATDQRGVERPQGSACDKGAFELEQEIEPYKAFIYLPVTVDTE